MRVSLLASALLFSAATVSAAELGTLSVTSSVNEPFKAQLQIRDVVTENQPISVRLASSATYARVGKTLAPEVQDLKLTLESKSPYRIRIEGKAPMRLQTFPLIIELAEGDKLSARLYSVRLVQPVVKPVAKTTQTSNVRTSTTETDARNHAKVLQEKRLKAETKKRHEDRFDVNKPFVIARGMNMWTIAKRYIAHYPEATIDQVAVGLLRANEKCFKNTQMSGLQPGCKLIAPASADVMAIPLADAWAHVRVNPNADATKPAQQRDIEKALRAMQKTSPSLYKRALDQINASTHSETSLNESRNQSAARSSGESEPQPVSAEGLAAAESPAAVQPTAPTEQAAKSISDEPSPSSPQASGQTVESAGQQSTPEATATTDQAVSDDAQDKPEETGEDSSFGGWVALILSIMAGAGGGYWWLRRRRKIAAEQESFEKKVRFTRPEPTTDDQIRGVDTMVRNRIEADAAAERGFPASSSGHQQNKRFPDAQENGSSSATDQKTTAPTSVSAGSPRATPHSFFEERREPTFLSEKTPQADVEQNMRFNVSTTYAGSSEMPRDGELPLKVEPTMASPSQTTTKASAMRLIEPDAQMIRACAEKLEISRQYISIGAGPKCKPLLESVILQGSLDQKSMAIDLLKKLGG